MKRTERGKLVGQEQFRLLVIQKGEGLMEWRGYVYKLSVFKIRV